METSAELQKSVLKLENLYFTDCSFTRKEDLSKEKIEYNYNFKREITESEDKQHFKVALCLNMVEQESKAVEITMRIVGCFAVETTDEKTKDTLIKKNTLTVLFPYLRGQLCLLTSQPGIQQIMLPIVNIAEMFNDEQT